MARSAKEEWLNFVQAASSNPEIIFDEIQVAAELLRNRNELVLTLGAGKSSYPAGKLAASLRSIGIPAFELSTGQILHGDLGAIHQGSTLFGISFSGETREVAYAFNYAKSIGARTISITGNVSSTIAQISDAHISLDWIKGGDYVGVVPTLSTSITNFTVDILITCIASKSGFTINEFARYHPGGYLGKILSTTVRHVMTKKDSTAIFSQSTNLIECAQTMSKFSKGLGIIVDQEGYLLGVISDGDIRRFIGSVRFDEFKTFKASDIMCKEPAFTEADNSLAEAIHIMMSNKPKRVSALPVTQKGKVCGLVSLVDIETFRSQNYHDSK